MKSKQREGGPTGEAHHSQSQGEVFPEVNPLVLGHVGAVPEGLAALATRVRLLPSVDPPVLQEVGALAEGLLTVGTLIWLLPVV